MDGDLGVEDVTVRFGGRPAVESVSVSFDRGTASALVGANGSGKTTLLNVLAGLIRPDEGRVIGGGDIALVRQLASGHGWMPLSVGEVLRIGRYGERRLLGRFTRRDHELIEASAARVGVADLVDQQLGELSGGQRQRVLVAQALIQGAPVLLLDEPVTGLDPPSRDTIIEVIRDEASAGRTVVFSTHQLDDARTADRVVALAGRIIATGPPDEILTADLLREVY